MKCVRIVGQGVPVRLTDAVAKRVVELEGDGEYCSKQFFRDWHKDPDARAHHTDDTGTRLMT